MTAAAIAACALSLLLMGLLFRLEATLRQTNTAHSLVVDSMLRAEKVATAQRMAEWHRQNPRHQQHIGHGYGHAQGNASLAGGCAD